MIGFDMFGGPLEQQKEEKPTKQEVLFDLGDVMEVSKGLQLRRGC